MGEWFSSWNNTQLISEERRRYSTNKQIEENYNFIIYYLCQNYPPFSSLFITITIWHHDTHYPSLSFSFRKKRHMQWYSIFFKLRVHKMVMYLPFGKKCHIVVSYPSYPPSLLLVIFCQQSSASPLSQSFYLLREGIHFLHLRRIHWST